MRLLASSFLITLLCFFSLPAFAADTPLPAGFAPGSTIWASQMNPVAGDKVTLYTVVYDSSSKDIEGAVSFYVDGEVVGSSPFTLKAGDTSVKSVSWTAVEGNHKIRATLATAIESGTKLPANISSASTGTSTITVSAAPVATSTDSTHSSSKSTSAATSAITNTATDLLAKVSSSSPIVGSVTHGVVSTTESIRQAGEDFLVSQSGVAASSTSTHATSTSKALGEVLGTTTYQAPVLGTPKTTFLQKTASTLLPIFKYPALFYPIFFFLLAFLFFFMAKRLGSPK